MLNSFRSELTFVARLTRLSFGKGLLAAPMAGMSKCNSSKGPRAHRALRRRAQAAAPFDEPSFLHCAHEAHDSYFSYNFKAGPSAVVLARMRMRRRSWNSNPDAPFSFGRF